MKTAQSHPKKRKHLQHTTGRASRRNRGKGEVKALPRTAIWIIAAFIVITVVVIIALTT